MVKKISFNIIIISCFYIFLYLLTPKSIFAQGLPTPRGQTTPTGFVTQVVTQAPFLNTANCDRCGYCSLGQRPAEVKAPSTWQKCMECLYPAFKGSKMEENKTLISVPTPYSNRYYIQGVGCLSTKPGEFASQMSRVFFSVVGGLAFLFFLYGAAIIATSQANPERLNQGKRVVLGSIIGLLFSLFAIYIIRFISTALEIPGFG